VLQGENVSKKQCPFTGLMYGGEKRRLNIAVHPHFCHLEKEQKLLILTKFFCNSVAY
jgi:hypothetical protein